MAGARRVLKLAYRELHLHCPYCNADLRVGTVMEKIRLARRACPKCDREFLIEDETARKMDLKKPSGSAKTIRAEKRKVR